MAGRLGPHCASMTSKVYSVPSPRLRSILLMSFATALLAIWLWLWLVSVLGIDTKGAFGLVTLVLDGLYVVAVPLLGISVLVTVTMSVVRHAGGRAGQIVTIVLVIACLCSGRDRCPLLRVSSYARQTLAEQTGPDGPPCGRSVTYVDESTGEKVAASSAGCEP